MSAAPELLARCRALGIDLTLGPDGTLVWEADADPPAEVLATLAEHKAEVLTFLAAQAGALSPCAGPSEPSEPSAGASPPRGPVEAAGRQQAAPAGAPVLGWKPPTVEELLADLRHELAYVERQYHAGRFPPLLAKVVTTYLSVIEGCADNREQEQARGWDPAELIHGGARRLLTIAAGKEWEGLRPPWEWGQPTEGR
jgi:hypothetical protein